MILYVKMRTTSFLFLLVLFPKLYYFVLAAKYFIRFMDKLTFLMILNDCFPVCWRYLFLKKTDGDLWGIRGQDGLFRGRGTCKPSPLKNGEKSNQNRSWIEFPSCRMTGRIPWKGRWGGLVYGWMRAAGRVLYVYRIAFYVVTEQLAQVLVQGD